MAYPAWEVEVAAETEAQELGGLVALEKLVVAVVAGVVLQTVVVVALSVASSLDQDLTFFSCAAVEALDEIDLYQNPQTHALFHPFVPSFLARLSLVLPEKEALGQVVPGDASSY